MSVASLTYILKTQSLSTCPGALALRIFLLPLPLCSFSLRYRGSVRDVSGHLTVSFLHFDQFVASYSGLYLLLKETYLIYIDCVYKNKYLECC